MDGADLHCWARGLSNQMLDALKDCRKAIKRDGEKPACLDGSGMVQLRLGHYAESIKAYEQAVAQNPHSAWSRYGLGLAKIRSGQTDAGHADLVAARALDPEVEARHQVWFDCGGAIDRMGNIPGHDLQHHWRGSKAQMDRLIVFDQLSSRIGPTSATVALHHCRGPIMSKDKSHKKDKSKKHDLFSLMLEQSEVFRDMVAHFQSAWAPKMSVHMSGDAANTAPVSGTVIAKKPTRAARSAKKPVTKKVASVLKKAVAAPATKKPVIATKKKSARKASGAKSSAPVVAKKSAVKTARPAAKKGSPRK